MSEPTSRDLLFDLLKTVFNTLDDLLTGAAGLELVTATQPTQGEAPPTIPDVFEILQDVQEDLTVLRDSFSELGERLEDVGEAVTRMLRVYRALEHLVQLLVAEGELDDPLTQAFLLADAAVLGLVYLSDNLGLEHQDPTARLIAELITFAASEVTSAFPQLTLGQRLGALGEGLGLGCYHLFHGENEAEVRQGSMHILRSAAAILGLLSQQGHIKRHRAMFGWDNTEVALGAADGEPLPALTDAQVLLQRTFTYQYLSNPGLSLSMLAVPADQGGPGVVLRGSGEVSVSDEAGPGWSFSLDGRLGGGAVVIPMWRAAASPPERPGGFIPEASFALSMGLRHDPGAAPTILGWGPCHLKIGKTKFEVYVEEAPAMGFRADFEEVQLILQAPEGEGFLRRMLGDRQIAVDLKLGLGWDSRSGWYWAGGAGGLDLTLPVTIPLGIGQVSAIHLSLATPEGASGLKLEISARLSLDFLGMRIDLDRLGYVIGMHESADNEAGLSGVEGLQLPKGVGVAVSWGPVKGHFALQEDSSTGAWVGAGGLSLTERLSLDAVALVSRDTGAMVMSGAVAFDPALELGLGIRLSRLGALLAVDRRFDLDAAIKGLKDGVLRSLLAPENPQASLPRLARDLDLLFPEDPGRHVFGLHGQLTWGPGDRVSADLGLLYDPDQPAQLILLGLLTAGFPTREKAKVQIKLDAVGRVDLAQRELFAFAQLYGSKAFGLKLSGSAAALIRAGDDPCFILSAGGFHPSFPQPAAIPKMKRLALKFPETAAFKANMEAYLAVVGASLHFGGRAELTVGVGGWASVEGGLGVDFLVGVAPTRFAGSAEGWFTIKVAGHTFLGVRVAVDVSGPRPQWQFHGVATVSLLWWDWDVEIDHRMDDADGTADALPPPVNIEDLVRDRLADPASWSRAGEALPGVRLRDPVEGIILADPTRPLVFRQEEVPLGVEIDRVGLASLDGPRRVDLAVTGVGGDPAPAAEVVTELFPTGAHFDLSDEEQLTSPAFRKLQAGVSIPPPGLSAAPTSRSVPVIYEELILGEDGAEIRSAVSLPAPDAMGRLSFGPVAAARWRSALMPSRRDLLEVHR